METTSGQSPDALELVEVLKGLGSHRRKLWERTYGDEFLDNLNKIRDEFRKALRADDRNAAGDLLCRFVNAANGERPEDSRRQMLAKLESIMEARRAALGSGDTKFDVMPAELGPEAEKAFKFWVRIRNERFTPEESRAYWDHPLPWLCEQLEQRLGIDRNDLETAAYRLTSKLGLREMPPLPRRPDGTVGDKGQPDWLWMIPKFKELDRDGTTGWLWQTLLDNFLNVLVEAGLAPAGKTGQDGKVEGHDLTPETKAILFVQERLKTTGKLPTKKAIAEVLDVNRRTLYTWTAFKVAYKKLQSETRRQPARGSKAKDGTLEAWRESGK